MSRGKAHGQDREYQVACRDVLTFRDHDLSPVEGEGIDVPFSIGGTTWTLDVVLRKPNGELLVVECRRRADPAKQEEIAAFAYKVELIRRERSIPVAGVFFAKKAPQIGVLKVAQFENITIACLAEGELPPGFVIYFHRYDAERELRCKDAIAHVPTGRARSM